MGKYFGTDGFRGEANIKLTAKNAVKIGRFIGWYFARDHKAKILIGKDTRISSDMLEAALSAGCASSGADVYQLRVTTTPSVSFLVRVEGFDCGVMISASHNPYYDNGIKLINSKGEKIEADIEKKIEEYIDNILPKIPYAIKTDIGRIFDYSRGREIYIEHVSSAANCEFKNIRVGIDCANGSASDLAKKLFNRLKVNASVINNIPDGENINDNCGSTHLEMLKKYVVDNKLDAGFAYDGDADRCLAVDENGNELDGDKIIFICAKYLKENGRLSKDTIVTTIMSNIGLYKACEKEGINVITTDVGDKYVSEKMASFGYSLGGEQTGHTIFREFASTGDGMVTSVMLLEAMTNKKAALSALANEVQLYPQLLKNIRVKDKTNVLKNENVKAAIDEARKSLGDNGRVLVRISGTEPLIRVMAEAPTDEICSLHVENIINIIKSEGLVE